jgi:hypothetical protein
MTDNKNFTNSLLAHKEVVLQSERGRIDTMHAGSKTNGQFMNQLGLSGINSPKFS